MSKRIPISDAEWQVMEVLWQRSPQASQEVIAALSDHQHWKPGTVKTLLNRLLKKKAVKHEKQGNRYLYSPAVSREDAVSGEASSFIERVCGGSLMPLLTHSAQSTRKLSDREIAKLREILDQQETD